MATNRVCANCKYLAAERIGDETKTICTLNPPQVFMIHDIVRNESGEPVDIKVLARLSAFPEVQVKQFCSKWTKASDLRGPNGERLL